MVWGDTVHHGGTAMMQKHEAAAHFAPAVKEAQMGQEMGLG